MQQELFVKSETVMTYILRRADIKGISSRARELSILNWGRQHIQVVTTAENSERGTVFDFLAVGFEADLVLFSSQHYCDKYFVREVCTAWRTTDVLDEFRDEFDPDLVSFSYQIGAHDPVWDDALVLEMVRFVWPALPDGQEKVLVAEWIDYQGAHLTPTKFHSRIYAAYVGLVASLREVVPDLLRDGPFSPCETFRSPTIYEVARHQQLPLEISSMDDYNRWNNLVHTLVNVIIQLDARAGKASHRVLTDLCYSSSEDGSDGSFDEGVGVDEGVDEGMDEGMDEEAAWHARHETREYIKEREMHRAAAALWAQLRPLFIVPLQ